MPKVDRGYHRELLGSGAFGEYDQSFRWKEANGTLQLLEWAVEDGLDGQILLGMDAARRGYYHVYDGAPGLAWLLDGFTALMDELGLDATLRHRWFVEAPARAFAFAGTAASEQGADAQGFADFAQVGVLALELEGRGAADHLHAVDARQRIEDLFRDAVREEFVLRIGRHVHEGQHRDGARGEFLRGRRGWLRCCGRGRGRGLARQRAVRRQHELVDAEPAQRQQQHGDDDAIHAPRRVRGDRVFRRHLGIALEAFRRELEDPGEDQRRQETDGEQQHQRAQGRGRHVEPGQHRARDLHDEPRADQVQARHADDVATAQFGDETHSGRPSLRKRAGKRGSFLIDASTGSVLMKGRLPSFCAYARSSHSKALSDSPRQA